MESGLPSPTMRFFRGEARVLMPSLVQELVWTIRQVAPDQCRDGIDHLPKFGFGLLDLVERISQRFLRLLSILNVSGGWIPAHPFFFLPPARGVAVHAPTHFTLLSFPPPPPLPQLPLPPPPPPS